MESGNISYENAVQEGIKEQQRLVSATEVVQAANAESTRLSLLSYHRPLAGPDGRQVALAAVISLE